MMRDFLHRMPLWRVRRLAGTAMPRFVVLHHELPTSERAGTHWDFMLEADGVLRTWALAAEPDCGREVAAEQLADHRLAYLEYEGPISENRGRVTQWDAGEYRIQSESADELIMQLAGHRLNGVATLRRSGEDQRWIFDFSS